METLNRKFKSSILYFVICLFITIAFPIMLKNAFACTIGLAGMALFGYNAFTCYKAMKNNDYISVVAVCTDVERGSLGVASYSKMCSFKAIDDSKINGDIILQIVKEKNIESVDKYKKNGNKKSIQKGGVYELVFLKKALGDDLTNAEAYDNSAFVDWSPIDESLINSNESKQEDEETNIEN